MESIKNKSKHAICGGGAFVCLYAGVIIIPSYGESQAHKYDACAPLDAVAQPRENNEHVHDWASI